MSRVDISVGRASLRQALAAVLPHVGDIGDRDRVRLMAASPERLIVVATDGFSVGTARVFVHDVAALPELPVIDLEPRAARELLAVFTPPKDRNAKAIWESEAFRLVATEHTVTVTEESELGDNRVLEVPRLPDPDSYPPVLSTLAEHLRAAPSYIDRIGLNPAYLARFIASAKAYGSDRLLITPRHGVRAHGTTFRVDETDFAGLLLPQHLTEDTTAADRTWAGVLLTLADAETTATAAPARRSG